ncbi:MAG TPA: ATP-binding cassette domain-containing protein [Acidimicrobiia bacterium]
MPARRLTAVLPAVALVAFLVWFGRAQATDRFWITLGIEAMWIATAVIGVNLLLGYTGLLSLGHYAFFVYGGFAGAIWAVEDWGLDPWLGFPVAFAVGLLLGALLALTCCHLRGFYLTVVTLAFGLIASTTALLFEGPFNGSSGRPVTEPLDTNFGFIDAANPNRPFVGLYWVGVGLLLLTLYASWNLVRSRWGRAYRAIRESELAARASGIPTYGYKVSAFALSAGIVAVAGVLAAQTNLQVTMVDGTSIVGQSFRYVIFAFFGGLGTLAGPIVGAFAFTLGFGVEVGGETINGRLGRYETLFFGALIIVVAIVAPRGVVGSVRQLAARVVQPRRLAAPRHRVAPLRTRPSTAGAGGDAETLLSVRGITKRFGGLCALDALDLTVARGTVHAVIGPNGSGKSTLVNAISGISPADAGSVQLLGREVGRRPAHRRTRMGVARTFQSCQIWHEMSVLENVMVGAHTRTRNGLARSLLVPLWLRREERRVRDRAWALVEFVGLSDRAGDAAGALPFADQRRLEIARALASDPELLLLDEPAAGMHPTDIRQLVELVRRIRAAGITVLLVEHHMDVVIELADHVTVLDFGRCISEGQCDEVCRDPRVIAAYLGDRQPRPRRAPVVTEAVAATATPPGHEPLLSVRNLSVQYGAARALEGIDVDVYDGELVALIGSNGAGKTTSLETFSGLSVLQKTVRGEVTFLGERIERRAAHRIARMGMAHVPEGRRIFPESSVEENLLLGAYRRRDDGVGRDLARVYERFPVLGDRRHAPAGLLSGGEQQMLAIGRGLAASPRFLLLDEPSLGLAPKLVDEVFRVLSDLTRDGVTVLVVEQMAEQALQVADRAYVLETGRIRVTGPAAEIAADPRVMSAYLGATPATTAS